MKSICEWTALEVIPIILFTLLLLFGAILFYTDYNSKKNFTKSFNYAYVLGDDGKFEKIRIKDWKKYHNFPDTVQIICTNGKQIYTHIRNVKLVNE